VIAVLSVFVVVLLSLLVTRFATVVLVTTGLSREAARFQTRSALSGVGFTTSEAEGVLNHPVRRRVIMFLMLFGSAGLVTVIAGLIISFTGTGADRDALWRSLILIGGLGAMLAISRNRWIDARLTGWIARIVSRYTSFEARDYARLLNFADGYAVVELQVREGDWVAGRTLEELDIRAEGAALLGITRPDRDTYIGVPIAKTRVRPGDTLVLYGRSAHLAELDRRQAGTAGDQEHTDAVARHHRTDYATSVRDVQEIAPADEDRPPPAAG